MNETVELILPAADTVGESPVWSSAEAALYWVDIVGRTMHRLEPDTGRAERRELPEFVTSVALAERGLVVGLVKRVCRYDFERLETLATVEPDLPGNRLNEAAVSPSGDLWVGTMQNNFAPDGTGLDITHASGALHEVAPDGTVTSLTNDAYGIVNTMAWDGTRFLVADTLTNTLYAHDLDPASGALGPRRIFAHGFERGAPDGSCLDAEGYLWNARWGGHCLVRFAPDGSVDRVLELPVTNPTSCTFGGPDLATMFVTSARMGIDDARLCDMPAEGGLLACDVGVRGVPGNVFAG